MYPMLKILVPNSVKGVARGLLRGALSGALCVLAGCASVIRAPVSLPVDAAQSWVQGGDSAAVASPWLGQFESTTLEGLVSQGLADNFALRQHRALVRERRHGVTVAGAALWPTLSAGLRSTRRRTVAGAQTNIGIATTATNTIDAFVASANLSWQIDLWGELRASQRAANLAFAAELADYVSAEQSLAANVASRYFAAIEAAQLEALFAARLQSVQESADIVQSGYRSGLNGALDVYLAQNTVDQERGNLAAAQQSTIEARAALELLLADYPAGRQATPSILPVLTTPVPVDLPVALLSRRPDLQSSWLNLLATDAQLAVAHRQRFPSFSITASLSDTQAPFNELLGGGPLAWSLLNDITQPLFQGGRLRSLERQARERVEQAEAVWLDTLFAAFAEVENSISQERALQEQLQAAQRAQSNADGALELALEQYQSGLVAYTTVLESQRRAFDAQTSSVRLAAAQLQNRIQLNRALGGAFDAEEDQRIAALFDELDGRAPRQNSRAAILQQVQGEQKLGGEILP